MASGVFSDWSNLKPNSGTAENESGAFLVLGYCCVFLACSRQWHEHVSEDQHHITYCNIFGVMLCPQVSYNSVINACAQTGYVERAEMWLEAWMGCKAMITRAPQSLVSRCCCAIAAIANDADLRFIKPKIVVVSDRKLIDNGNFFLKLTFTIVLRLGRMLEAGVQANEAANQMSLQEQNQPVSFVSWSENWVKGQWMA